MMPAFQACQAPDRPRRRGSPRIDPGILAREIARQQGKNWEFLRFTAPLRKIRLENSSESCKLRDPNQQIPCAMEQGIQFAPTGNRIRANRELIRPQQGIGAKSTPRVSTHPNFTKTHERGG
jgi:hypothetical protein